MRGACYAPAPSLDVTRSATTGDLDHDLHVDHHPPPRRPRSAPSQPSGASAPSQALSVPTRGNPGGPEVLLCGLLVLLELPVSSSSCVPCRRRLSKPPPCSGRSSESLMWCSASSLRPNLPCPGRPLTSPKAGSTFVDFLRTILLYFYVLFLFQLTFAIVMTVLLCAAQSPASHDMRSEDPACRSSRHHPPTPPVDLNRRRVTRDPSTSAPTPSAMTRRRRSQPKSVAIVVESSSPSPPAVKSTGDVIWQFIFI